MTNSSTESQPVDLGAGSGHLANVLRDGFIAVGAAAGFVAQVAPPPLAMRAALVSAGSFGASMLTAKLASSSNRSPTP